MREDSTHRHHQMANTEIRLIILFAAKDEEALYSHQSFNPKKKKCKKPKWLSEEALQIAVKSREAKGKGGMERYTHLNAGFQRIARRDKKAFLSDQKTIEWERLEISSRKLERSGEHFMQRWARERTETVRT